MRSRQKIIDATLGLIETSGFGAVNIASVAAAAGVSRQTIYSIFGTREELVSQSVLSIAVTVLERMSAAALAEPTATRSIVEMMVSARGELLAHPVLASLLIGGDSNPLYDPGMMSRAVTAVLGLLEPMAEREPAFAAALPALAEVIARTGISIVLFESDAIATEDGVRALLTNWLVPAVEAAMAKH